MSNFFGVMSIDEVVDEKTFASFCQQKLGTPYPSGKSIAILRKQSKEFFENNPRANWGTLVRTVEWCRNANKRLPNAYSVFSFVRYAWSKGYLPELDPVQHVDASLEEQISRALRVETDERWKNRLVAASGDGRREVYNSWVEVRGGLCDVG